MKNLNICNAMLALVMIAFYDNASAGLNGTETIQQSPIATENINLKFNIKQETEDTNDLANEYLGELKDNNKLIQNLLHYANENFKSFDWNGNGIIGFIDFSEKLPESVKDYLNTSDFASQFKLFAWIITNCENGKKDARLELECDQENGVQIKHKNGKVFTISMSGQEGCGSYAYDIETIE